MSNVHQAYTSVTTCLSGQLHVRQGVVVVVDAVVDHVQGVVRGLGVLLFGVDVGWDQRGQRTQGDFRLLLGFVNGQDSGPPIITFSTVLQSTAVLHARLEFHCSNATDHATDFYRDVGVQEVVLLLVTGELDVAQELGAVQVHQVIVVPSRLSDLNAQVRRMDRVTVWRVEVDLIDHGQIKAASLETFRASIDDQLTSRDPSLLEGLISSVLFVQTHELSEVLAVHRTV
ncbi:hypothetical protein D3C78_1160550 [compost metagenome]